MEHNAADVNKAESTARNTQPDKTRNIPVRLSLTITILYITTQTKQIWEENASLTLCVWRAWNC
jgi:hypothetical protein